MPRNPLNAIVLGKRGITDRMLGHVTYLSDVGMQRKFGRRAGESRTWALDTPELEVERYLNHQGRSFVRRFDANSLLRWAITCRRMNAV